VGKLVEAIIPETIPDLLAFGLKRVVPAHGTGWRAFTAIAKSCDEGVLTPSAAGRTFVF
jgi:7,8-dihydropterin-6-yl-methyl-4-(beta-D-ribofuranosyl)aminobenzene 5'-phosphate synthase